MAVPAWVTIELDASLHDATTLEWGLAEADLRAAPVLLVRVVPGHDEPVQGEWYPSPHHPLRTEAAFHLEDAAEREGARRPGVRIATRLLPEPRTGALSTVSRTSQLLVVGAHAGGPARVGAASPWASASASANVHLAARAGCPVAVVTGRSARPPDAGPVVVGVDGSPHSGVAGVVAADEAVLRGTTLVLLHAGTAGGTHRDRGARHVHPAHAADPADRLDGVVASVRRRHPALAVTVEVVRTAPADALVDRSRTAALLVVGTRGLGAVRGSLLGSVSSEVVRRADGVVLVVHDRDDDAGTPAGDA